MLLITLLVVSILSSLVLPILEGRVFHVRCACHIINLVVQECLQFFHVNLETLRLCLQSLNTFASRQQTFKTLCAQYGITFRRFVKDVPYKWNSTYLILKYCIRFKDVITYYCNVNPDFDYQTTENWLIPISIYEFLELFYNATCILSGVYYPTSPLVLTKIINMSHLFFIYRTVPDFDYVVSKMERKFRKYWGEISPLYCSLSIFDLKFKLDGVFILLDDFHENMNVDVC